MRTSTGGSDESECKLLAILALSSLQYLPSSVGVVLPSDLTCSMHTRVEI